MRLLLQIYILTLTRSLNKNFGFITGFPLFFDNFLLGYLGEFRSISHFFRIFLLVQHEKKKNIQDILGYGSRN